MKSIAINSESGLETAGFYLVSAMLVFAPLYRGGNRPLSLLVLELLAFVLIFLCLMRPLWRDHVPLLMRLTIIGLALFPLLYLIPVPESLWLQLPGRAFYSPALALGNDHGLHWRPISINPLDSEGSFLTILVPLAVFFGTVGLHTSRLKFLVKLLLSVAAGEAFLGLVQYAGAMGGSLYLGIEPGQRSALGTYVNRNHLAGLLVMVLPVALALFAANLGLDRLHGGPAYHHHLRARLASFLGRVLSPGVLYGFSALLILLGIIFTRSRTGVAMAMIAVFLVMLLFSRRLGRRRSVGIIGMVTVIGVVLAGEIGLFPVWQRFAIDQPLGHIRLSVFSSTIDAIGAFFPVGSGPGTFAHVYPRFQPPELYGTFVNHAHNDYLECFLEWGLAGALFVVLLAACYAQRWRTLWRHGEWSTFRFCQVGAGIGLLLMAGHGMTDFNFHIPANAVYFAFLGAIYFHRHTEEDQIITAPAERHRPDHLRPPPARSSNGMAPPRMPKPNPFLD